jgi:hypothetical protein
MSHPVRTLLASAGIAILCTNCGGSPTTPTPPDTPPPVTNVAPVIAGITAQGPRANQPANMADLGEAIAIAATVSDAETLPTGLAYEWNATHGTFTGASGPAATWRAPASLTGTPVDATLTLTVVETYTSAGQPREHRVSRTVDVRIHNSPAEIAAVSREFLEFFSQSTVPPAQVVANFWDGCGGKAAELADTQDIRCEVTHDAYAISTPSATVVFGGSCPWPHAPFLVPGDGCAQATVHWETTANPGVQSCPNAPPGLLPGQKEVVDGIDFLSLVYRTGRWRLCESGFASTGPLHPAPSRH